MKTVAVLGNSQVATLKMAWDAGGADDLQPTYFSLPGGRFFDLQFDAETREFGVLNRKAWPHDNLQGIIKRNGRAKLSLDGFDAIVIAGQIQGHLPLYELMVCMGVDGWEADDFSLPLTMPAYHALVDDIAAHDTPVWPLETLAPVPVIIIPPARIAETVATSEKERPGHEMARVLLERPKVLARALDDLDAAYARVIAGRGFHYIPQAPETFGTGGLTSAAYSRGARALSGDGFGDDDHTHMNKDYGALVLAELARIVRAT